MKKRRIGFITPSGTITAMITIIVVAGIGSFWGGRLFNPGALSEKQGPAIGGVRSHSELSNNCSSCHAPFWGSTTMADRCVACHTDINTQWQTPASLHGKLRQDSPALKCKDCHTEHHGANAATTDMSQVSVSHEGFGFSLNAHKKVTTGKSFQCNDCHTSGYTQYDQNECATCHQISQPDFMQTHIEAYGKVCLNCHDGVDRYGSAFDHNLVTFQLTGKHQLAECGQCHNGDHTIADLQNTKTECVACHAKDDVHNGELGNNCESCHTSNGWMPSTFDHSLASFILTGKHATTPCESCHVDKIFKGTAAECNACHKKDDVHNGELGSNCLTCHNTDGWTDAIYDHNLASFKLIGKHASVNCKQCHADFLFKDTPTNCYACHAKDDAHAGQFGTACENCHTSKGWLPASFDHNLASFKLTGKHAGVSCGSCHVNNTFKSTPTDCYACHAKDDTHKGQFGTACGSCHSPNGWDQASFDHSQFFPLSGGHANLACTQCHKNGGFGGLSTACSTCHSDPAFHAGQFSGTSCNQCHSTTAWTPASYTGPHPGGCDGNCINHRRATCRDCHTVNLMTATCTKCHDNNNPGGGD
jgi:hypothetical protein